MRFLFQKITYSLLAPVFIFGATLSFFLVSSPIYAAPISSSNPITLHITNSRFTDTAVTARNNLLKGAFKQGGASAQQQMQANLDNGNIQITKDAASAWDDSTSYLTFEGKPVGGYGEKGIQDGFSKILSDPNNLPPGAEIPADEKLVGKDIVVGTEQIYVDPLTHEGQMFIPKPSKPIKPPTISPEKQQELAVDEANGVPITAVGNEITFTHPATVNLGVEVGPGTYQVGKCQKNQSPGTGYVQPDASGNFTSCAEPKAPGSGSDSGFGNGGGSNPGSGEGLGGSGAGGLGGLGGLGQMLPLLLASMLGGGLGGQGGQGQNGLGSNGYGNGLTNTQTSCSQYGVSPVCGSDGKTYNNSCWLQQLGQIQVSVGVCPTTSASPSPTPDVAKIVTQLLAAGVPQSVIDTIVKSFSAFTSNVRGSDVVIQ